MKSTVRASLEQLEADYDRAILRFARACALLAGRTADQARQFGILIPARVNRRIQRWALWGQAQLVIYRAANDDAKHRVHALLVTPDLSLSGAPRVVSEIADRLGVHGFSVTIGSPLDGPLRAMLVAAGHTVIIDPMILNAEARSLKFLRPSMDVALCNTIVPRGTLRALHAGLPTIWYIHEVSLTAALLEDDPWTKTDLARAFEVWCGSEQAASLVRPYRNDVRTVPYGLAPLTRLVTDCPGETHATQADRPVTIAVFGSLEERKGQDLAIEAVMLLAPSTRQGMTLTLYGRTFSAEYAALLSRAADGLPVRLGGELELDGYRQALLATDVVLVPSRDDTLPLVSLDALGAGKVLACTPTTGTSAYLHDGVDGFVAQQTTARSIADMLNTVLDRRGDWHKVGEQARAVFRREFSIERFTSIIVESFERASAASCPARAAPQADE